MSDSNQVMSVATGLYATPKKVYLEQCRNTISKMQKEIAELEKRQVFLEPGTFDYFKCQKRIARCASIIKDCEHGIFLMETQMNLQTHERFRGL